MKNSFKKLLPKTHPCFSLVMPVVSAIVIQRFEPIQKKGFQYLPLMIVLLTEKV